MVQSMLTIICTLNALLASHDPQFRMAPRDPELEAIMKGEAYSADPFNKIYDSSFNRAARTWYSELNIAYDGLGEKVSHLLVCNRLHDQAVNIVHHMGLSQRYNGARILFVPDTDDVLSVLQQTARKVYLVDTDPCSLLQAKNRGMDTAFVTAGRAVADIATDTFKVMAGDVRLCLKQYVSLMPKDTPLSPAPAP